MDTMKLLVLGATSAAVLSALSPALAQEARAAIPPEPNPVLLPVANSQKDPQKIREAERLFAEAVARMDRADYETACPLLEQSQALDPSSGTLLNLGDCYEHLGLTAAAWRAFREARDLAVATARKDRSEVAALRQERLSPKLRRFKVIPPARPVSDVTITLDRKPLPTSLWNTPVPVDPGVHVIRAGAPGMREHVTEVPAPPVGSISTVSIPDLVPQGTSESPATAQGDTAPTKIDAQGTAAIACGVLGVAGVVGGTVFGLRSRSKRAESDRYCEGNLCSDPRGVERMDEARSAGNLSTVSFLVGGAGLGAAAVLWFVRPFGEGTANPQVGLGPGSVLMHGRF